MSFKIEDIHKNLVFVDVETTGFDAANDRIIEIGVISVIEGEIADEYSQLINPQVDLPAFSESLTGISRKQLTGAPVFREVKEPLFSMINKGLFIAHNVLFDYSFIQNEFLRSDMYFVSDMLCTVELSRTLYPQYSSHSLDSISRRFGIKIQNRHRALDDAKALWTFIQNTLLHFGEERVYSAMNKLILRGKKKTKKIPESQISLV